MADQSCFNNQKHVIVEMEIGTGVRLTAGEIVDGSKTSVIICRRCGRLIEQEPYDHPQPELFEAIPFMEIQYA